MMKSNGSGVSRRQALKGLGAAFVTSSTGVAGCVGTNTGGQPNTLTLGTIPVFPMMQQFVIEQQGWYEDELSPSVNIESFGGGPSLIQAYASGDLDFAYVGISPGSIAIAKGVPSQVVAANVIEPNVMVANQKFRTLWTKYGKNAFARFQEEYGRKPVFATLPPGSTPDVFLRFWIQQKLGLNLQEAVSIKGMGASALRSTLLAGKVDGGSVIEPIPTILKKKSESMHPFRYAGAIMPGQPGAVLQPSQSLIDNNPDIVRKLVELHIRATEFIHENREQAAVMASNAIGKNVLPPTIAKQAIQSPAANFISNPHRIVDKTLVYNEFHQKLGKVSNDLSEKEIFNFTFFNELS
ncbi:MAG: ABC transporter substrate-binding protein [Halobacteriaceae archaeon]